MTSKGKAVNKPKHTRKTSTETVKKKVASKKNASKKTTNSKKAASKKTSAGRLAKKKPVSKKLATKKKQAAKKTTSKKKVVKNSSQQKPAPHTKVDSASVADSSRKLSTAQSKTVENISLHIKEKPIVGSSTTEMKNAGPKLPGKDKLMSDTPVSKESANPVIVGASNTAEAEESMQRASVTDAASLPSASKGASRSWWPILVIAGLIILGATSFFDYTGSGDSLAEESQGNVINTALIENLDTTVSIQPSGDSIVDSKVTETSVPEVDKPMINKVIEEELPVLQVDRADSDIQANVEAVASITEEAVVEEVAPESTTVPIVTDASAEEQIDVENTALENEQMLRNMVAFNSRVAAQNRRWLNWARQQYPPLYYGIVPPPEPYQHR